jgi:hypothetical protein
VHADYVRDFMTVVFSHPRVRAFIMWGFWEGSHWRAKDSAAMFRRDWSRRPAQDVYEELVLKQWWTRWSGTTGADGSAALRAFFGRHRAQAEVNGQVLQAEVDLARGQPATVLLRLP